MKPFVGYARDAQLRRDATSGGVGSALLNYLFKSGQVETSLTFDFNPSTLRYSPRLIHRWRDYRPTGAIYQDMDLIGYLRAHLAEIHGRFACFCLPCQAASLRILLKDAGHDSILLGLVCSSQQTLAATERLLDLAKIRREDVGTLQYRGGGWPGGIRIGLKNGGEKFIKNNGSVWTDIFHSRLCMPKRCLYCQNTFNDHADIALADPWLPEYLGRETPGFTLVVSHTPVGDRLLSAATDECVFEEIPEEKVLQSQCRTLDRKAGYATHPWRRTVLNRMRAWNWYVRLVFSNPRWLKFHRKIFSRCKL